MKGRFPTAQDVRRTPERGSIQLQTRRTVVLGTASAALSAFAGESSVAQGGGENLGFASGGKAIRVERFEAQGGGRRPAILLLHGADGLSFGERYRIGARIMASAGYHVFLIHYLDRTGQSRASYSTIGSHFAAWMDTIRDGLTVVQAQPGVDRRRLGLLGTSLGGALAIAVAAEDRRVRAVADYFGFLPQDLAARATRLPPTLVLHGARDAIVPVSNAYALEALLRKLRVPHQIHVYPDQAHGFSGAAQLDAAQRTAAFFHRYLAARSATLAEETDAALAG
jgi:dienelactone hydrolase